MHIFLKSLLNKIHARSSQLRKDKFVAITLRVRVPRLCGLPNAIRARPVNDIVTHLMFIDPNHLDSHHRKDLALIREGYQEGKCSWQGFAHSH